jgi:hypothetical protein
MKIGYSPLISEARGSAGPITASKWKGIAFIRERVTPANPKTADQIHQRRHMTRANMWWHDLEAQLSDYIDTLVDGLAMSGFNAFTKRNVKDMHELDQCRIVPLNSQINPITTAVAATGAGAAGTLVLTWDQAEATTGHKVYVLAGALPDPGEDPPNLPHHLAVASKDAVLVQTETATLTALTPDVDYGVFILVENTVTHEFSVADFCTGTSHA